MPGQELSWDYIRVELMYRSARRENDPDRKCVVRELDSFSLDERAMTKHENYPQSVQKRNSHNVNKTRST